MKPLYIVIVLVLVVGATIFATQYLGQKPESVTREQPTLQDQQQTTTTQSTIDNKTGEWITYRNDKYGFEFKYPADYLIKEGRTGLCCSPLFVLGLDPDPIMVDFNPLVEVWVWSTPIPSEVDNVFKRGETEVFAVKQVLVAGRKSFRYEGVDGHPESPDLPHWVINTIVEKGNFYYMIAFTEQGGHHEGIPNKNKLEIFKDGTVDVYNRIVDSFLLP